MNEYISKKTIIDALEEENERQPFQPTSIYSCVIPFIRKLPAAEVQPVKHGKWDGYICSECNACADYFISGDFYFDEKPNFCPNCGARMDGDKK